MIKELSISGSNDQLLLKNGHSPGGSNSPKTSKRLEGGTGKFTKSSSSNKNNNKQKIKPRTRISWDGGTLCHVFHIVFGFNLFFCSLVFFLFLSFLHVFLFFYLPVYLGYLLIWFYMITLMLCTLWYQFAVFGIAFAIKAWLCKEPWLTKLKNHLVHLLSILANDFTKVIVLTLYFSIIGWCHCCMQSLKFSPRALNVKVKLANVLACTNLGMH